MGLVNQPVKFNTKWLLTFETDYQRLFETNANQANKKRQVKRGVPKRVMVELFWHAINEQPEHICQLIFTLRDPTDDVQLLEEEDDLKQLLQLTKGKE